MPPTPPSHWPDPYAPAAPNLRPHHPAFSSLPLKILTLPRRPQDMPLTPTSTPLTPNPLSAAYYPYAQVLDP
ncbi:hypothetical protein O181_087484 [Austropuccinia psidii MF-1]|uniref:Uncharacterized protein n=1 Tax=Austropuccinia psidii MF-1 TaxID=1389203 RepID=A0A9Q3IPU1_9BASI|nr:hypothetical protein [Austropuccinia psidii MF-1]